MARPEIPDTSALLDALRRPDRWPALERSLRSGHVWLSSVVLAELYAGTRSPDDRMALDRITLAMRRVDRILTPDASDWMRAGRLIARRIRLHGDLRPRDHLAVVSLPRWGDLVHTHGSTCEEAVQQGQELIEALVSVHDANGAPLPRPRVFAGV